MGYSYLVYLHKNFSEHFSLATCKIEMSYSRAVFVVLPLSAVEALQKSLFFYLYIYRVPLLCQSDIQSVPQNM
jgi:hypothetical protein